ncbi:LacI family DNA-binding transcriptional regulator [Sphingomonas montanisoli]|uniref:LacI family transcriptional regulator n=1 Tax=Sphingomonas montanisoli TaxID=2606412 RepID=A0A5D9CEX8_9SPHN|nr:LacI family DNA-binding transcriptional regulator [Sphingomonas montanisoli]TZG28671.1 LacI family transcriptional regulator [Sphingomonas montanisoli]
MTRKPREGVTSISDLARLAGVSASTVSRALAGSSMISEGTRARVKALAREHGFRLNQMARNLRLRRSQAIGLVLPMGHEVGQHLSDPFFGIMLGYLAEGVTARGYDLLLSRIVPTEDGWLDGLANSGRIDGLIVLGQSDQSDALDRLAAEYRPLIVWGERQEGQLYCSVGTDNRIGGMMAAQHVLAQGRRRILFAGCLDVPETAARYAGYIDAHREAGVEPFGKVEALFEPAPAFAAIAERLNQGELPDAIVAASDVIAIEAIKALKARGLNVPDDVAVTGFDDVPVAELMAPALTTIRQDFQRGAGEMVDRLFRRHAGEDVGSLVMAPTLVKRASA